MSPRIDTSQDEGYQVERVSVCVGAGVPRLGVWQDQSCRDNDQHFGDFFLYHNGSHILEANVSSRNGVRSISNGIFQSPTHILDRLT